MADRIYNNWARQMIKISKGLNLPITGEPEQKISQGNSVTSVAIVGAEYNGMKPTMAVKVGDKVKKGQLLFTDKKTEGVRYTAPAAGEVIEVNRGAKRVFQSVVIKLQGNEEETFASYDAGKLSSLSAEKVQENLVNSGLWTALRTRPFSKVPALGSKPSSLFITAMDTNPLTADAAVVIAEKKASFEAGVNALSALTDGKTFVCKAPNADIPAGTAQVEEFAGPHPAGLAGTHIHFLDAASDSKTVWSIGYQDVIAVGELFLTGKLYSDRVVAIAGPAATKPRLVRTLVGANLNELTKGETNDQEIRVISGSVFGGRTSTGAFAYLGRFANQVSILNEDRTRPMFHYLRPGFNVHSVKSMFASALTGKKLAMTTTTNGSERAMMPIGQFEKIMPLDILPTQLLRSIVVSDVDMAIKLGVLELDEDDLALCTYACPGKYEYGQILRNNLTQIEKEG
jgi:Na+-transporting NADH:ubiquinone oxidoreductase subunit A